MTDIPEDVREAMAKAYSEAAASIQVTYPFAKSDEIPGIMADAALAALRAAGWVIVPAEATDDMVRAGSATRYPDGSTSLYVAWRAMIEAAAPPARREEV